MAIDLLDDKFLIDWNEKGIEQLLNTIITSNDNGGCRFIERYERVYAWTWGIVCYSTGINGTHIALFTANDAECSNAALLAQRIVYISRDMPGWRKLELTTSISEKGNGDYNLSISVCVYGGKYRNN